MVTSSISEMKAWLQIIQLDIWIIRRTGYWGPSGSPVLQFSRSTPSPQKWAETHFFSFLFWSCLVLTFSGHVGMPDGIQTVSITLSFLPTINRWFTLRLIPERRQRFLVDWRHIAITTEPLNTNKSSGSWARGGPGGPNNFEEFVFFYVILGIRFDNNL